MSCLVIGLIIAAVGVPVLGVLSSLAIYGVRRYLVAAKTAEAKNTIGAIARAARAAYEREHEPEEGTGKTHSLCRTAIPVPVSVPSGRKYMPGTGGVDFDTGDSVTGWKCLRFAMTMPIYYQYSYYQGSGYAGGPPSPGPDGFQAAAVGDLDGDVNVSTFAIGGRISGNALVVDPQIYIEDEFE